MRTLNERSSFSFFTKVGVCGHSGKLVIWRRTDLRAEQNHGRHRQYLMPGFSAVGPETHPRPCDNVDLIICFDYLDLVSVF